MTNILPLNDNLSTSISTSGGKGANLSKLINIDGICVPQGFIVTTHAFNSLYRDILKTYKKDITLFSTSDEIETYSMQIQNFIKAYIPPQTFAEEIDTFLDEFPDDTLFAVRSSATAEDLPTASFAGQQDSYLNINKRGIISSIINCFASLYNPRAVAYRSKNGFEESLVSMAVVVQEMIPSEISGVLFTADPTTSDRFTSVVEAVYGLSDDLVSGYKTPHTYKIHNGELKYSSKLILTEDKLKELVSIGRKIENFFSCPQDIEWCFYKNKFYIVQSRPITTLFPAPKSHDGLKRTFVSLGHMQMMTDIMLPLGMDFMKMVSTFKVNETGGRLYIDITNDIKNPYGRKMINTKFKATDPLTYSSVKEIMGRKEYLKTIPKGQGSFSSFKEWPPMVKEAIRIYKRNNPKDIDIYVEKSRRELANLESKISMIKGNELLDFISQDQKNLLNIVYEPTGFGIILATQFVIPKIDKAGKILTGNDNLSNALSKSVYHNITSAMGLALNHISDSIRDHPEIIEYLRNIQGDFNINELSEFKGGEAIVYEFENFMALYGMRATGEIDISKPRFRENPSTLINTILSNIDVHEKEYGKKLFLDGQREVKSLINEILSLSYKKMGLRKTKKLKRYISFFRHFVGCREYPKYFWICRYDIYKKAFQREAKSLLEEGIIKDENDIFYLYFDELKNLVNTRKFDYSIIETRKKNYEYYKTLTPPRVIFSDGEVPTTEYAKDIPKNALPGLGVSGGVVEGKARIIMSIKDSNINKDEILVTPFTDPSWTPVFLSIKGLVTEVGGMMTHGAVITREFGLPAVVAVVDATKKISDGDYIRVNGDEGYVEILKRNNV